jgi:hypothetical protein
MSERLLGEQGYLYYGKLEDEITGEELGTELPLEGFYKVVSKGASSGLPAGLGVKDVFFNKPAVTLQTGDVVVPITRERIAFVTNVPHSASKSKHENTTQQDTVKSFAEGKRAELTGSVEGYFLDADASGLQDELLSRFKPVTIDDGAGGITVLKSDGKPLHFFLSRYESEEVGKQEVTDYLPVITESITLDKPLEGNQVFTFNYTVVGSEKPTTYRRTITA